MKSGRKAVALEETGKFLIDIAKLVFGGVILAGIMEYENLNSWLLFTIGSICVVVFFVVGLIFTTLSKLEEEE